MLGRAADELCHGDGVHILQLPNLRKHVRDFAQVADVDASIVHCLREGQAVHWSRRVVQAVSDLFR